MTLTIDRTQVGLEQTGMKAAEAVTEAGTRVLEFYAAAFGGNPDRNGDVLDTKAFDAWLPKFYDAGQSLKLSFNHAAFLDDLDPTNVVGFASADPEHVWVDSYGLRVKGELNVKTEKGRAVEWQVEKGLLTGASLAYGFKPENVELKSDHKVVKSVERVFEAGLVPHPANQNAVLLWMKSEGLTEQTNIDDPYMSVAELEEVMKSGPRSAQDWHDALVSQGAVCGHVLDTAELQTNSVLSAAAEALETPTNLTDEDQDRLRRLRYLEMTEL